MILRSSTIPTALPTRLSVCSALAKVLEGSRYDGKAADVWSSAAVLFTMLAGFSPPKIAGAEVRNK